MSKIVKHNRAKATPTIIEGCKKIHVSVYVDKSVHFKAVIKRGYLTDREIDVGGAEWQRLSNETKVEVLRICRLQVSVLRTLLSQHEEELNG